jgi:CheY-like chemotaxis protein
MNPRGSAGSSGSSDPHEAARVILFVEDVLEQREPATVLLRERGYSVVEATDGGQAVRLATKHLPDVVVMDVSLPIMDGIEAIRRIRALPGKKRPHVIVMSGQLDGRTRQLGFEAGCDQYITKPCGIEALAASIDAYFLKRDGA